MRIVRPTLSSATLCVATALYLLTVTNLSFWRKLGVYFAAHPSKLVVLAAALLLIHIAMLLVFSARPIVKTVLIALIIVAAAGSYFVDTFGTVINRNVIDAVMTTTSAESGALITPHFLRHMLLYGLVPSMLIAWPKLSTGPFLPTLAYRSGAVILCLFGAIALLGSDYGSFASMYREHREDIVSLLMPTTPVRSLVSYYTHDLGSRSIVMKPLGTDARQTLVALPSAKPLLTVIVVGETARAANFSLFGYARDTNPELEKRNVIAFPNTTSCGTDTGVSLPCMFSPFTRSDYSHTKFLGSENLLDVLKHAGVDVAWYDNNTGSNGVGDRIDFTQLQDRPDKRFCDAGECRDGILVEALKTKLNDIKVNTTVVLHMIGSHGPAYYRRYPSDFARFKPDCRSNEFSDCSTDEIVNAYDNSILYTDHVLGQIVDLLDQNRSRVTPAMLYISDHGESLGENGLYLHAAPYLIAPEVQTHVPFVAWLSPEFSGETKLDPGCLAAGSAQPASHDNLFHSVLGMMGVATSVYDRSLDRFADCRDKVHSS
jgi:lipid A ethanolaminephosphotransferase